MMIKGWVTADALKKCDFHFEKEREPLGAVVLVSNSHVQVQYDGDPRDSESYDDPQLAKKLVSMMRRGEADSFVITEL
jgi:hypothetical protein